MMFESFLAGFLGGLTASLTAILITAYIIRKKIKNHPMAGMLFND